VTVAPAGTGAAASTVRFTVQDTQTAIQKVEYASAGDRWRQAYPLDGLLDSREERFELALAAGADPIAFRLAHLKDPRGRAVIEKVAELAKWKPGDKSDGTRGRGIGFSKYKNLACYVAVIADVEIDRASGRVRVTRAYAATDAGLIINPDGLTAQIEGGVIQSTSWTLHEEVKFDRNGILSRDWSNYPILTMPEAPAVEVALINRPSERSLGAGEGSQGPTVAAIANAFTHATGKRIRDLPFHPERVKAALG